MATQNQPHAGTETRQGSQDETLVYEEFLDDDLFDELEEKARRIDSDLTAGLMDDDSGEEERQVGPVIILAFGGTGGEIARQIKARTRGLSLPIWILVFDTDETARGPKNGLPGFDHTEFVHLSMDRVKNVLTNPDGHPHLRDRLDLHDDETCKQYLRILDAGAQQAGQVRSLGLLALHANMHTVITALNRVRNAASGRWQGLRHQLGDASQRLNLDQVLKVYSIFSLGGGTGSAIHVDVSSHFRHEVGNNVDITAIATLPEVHEERFLGEAAQYERVQANSTAALIELEAINSGLGSSMLISTRRDERTTIPFPLYNSVYKLGRRDAGNKDLGSDIAVFDTAASNLFAEMTTPIASRLRMAADNSIVQQGLANDPETNRKRWASTLASVEIGLPIRQLLKYCVFNNMVELFISRVIGPECDLREMEAHVDDWLHKAQLEERNQHNADEIIDQLISKAIPDMELYWNRCYKRVTRGQREYYPARDFPPHFEKCREQFFDRDLPAIESQIIEEREILRERAGQALGAEIAQQLDSSGLRRPLLFLKALDPVLRAAEDELRSEVTDDTARVQGWDDKARDALAPFTKFLSRMALDSPKQQELVIRTFSNLVRNAINSIAKAQAADLLRSLRGLAEQHRVRIDEALEASTRRHAGFEEKALASRPHERAITGDNMAQVSIASPELFKDFYESSRISGRDLLRRVAKRLEMDPVSLVRTMGGSDDLTRAVMKSAQSHFEQAIDGVSILPLLEQQFKAGGAVRTRALARLENAIKACQPLLRVNLDRIDQQFGDTLVLGMPSAPSPDLKQVIAEAAACLQRDPRYQAHLGDPVITGDAHRIYVIRRSHGARPEYLADWSTMMDRYRSWRTRGIHPLHVFPEAQVSTMPSLDPLNRDASRGELSFAIALAYGWVARRGNYYYDNLIETDDRGRKLWEVPLRSEWPGAAGDGSGLDSMDPALQEFCQTGEMTYHDGTSPDPNLQIAQGREEARSIFASKTDEVEEVMNAFGRLRAHAGNAKVTEQLEAYVRHLSRAYRPGSALYEQVQQELTLLRRLLSDIRDGVC